MVSRRATWKIEDDATGAFTVGHRDDGSVEIEQGDHWVLLSADCARELVVALNDILGNVTPEGGRSLTATGE